jgi:hypothetical protein
VPGVHSVPIPGRTEREARNDFCRPASVAAFADAMPGSHSQPTASAVHVARLPQASAGLGACAVPVDGPADLLGGSDSDVHMSC